MLAVAQAKRRLEVYNLAAEEAKRACLAAEEHLANIKKENEASQRARNARLEVYNQAAEEAKRARLAAEQHLANITKENEASQRARNARMKEVQAQMQNVQALLDALGPATAAEHREIEQAYRAAAERIDLDVGLKPIAKDCACTIHHLQVAKSYNGCTGTVIALLQEKARYLVLVHEPGKLLTLKPENLTIQYGTKSEVATESMPAHYKQHFGKKCKMLSEQRIGEVVGWYEPPLDAKDDDVAGPFVRWLAVENAKAVNPQDLKILS